MRGCGNVYILTRRVGMVTCMVILATPSNPPNSIEGRERLTIMSTTVRSHRAHKFLPELYPERKFAELRH